jgi:hypothetical protein
MDKKVLKNYLQEGKMQKTHQKEIVILHRQLQ